MVDASSQSFDIEGELERLIEQEESEQPEVVAVPESHTVSQIMEADTQEFGYAVEPEKDYSEHIAIIEKLVMVATHYDSKIEDNDYTRSLKSSVQNMIVLGKLLQSYYENHDPEDVPPTSLCEVKNEWVRLKPVMKRLAES